MAKARSIQAIRGMHDVVPEEVVYWQHLESVIRNLVAQYHYQEIRFPIVELTELFARTVGDVTDIVEKEMYTFLDRNGDSLSLRPEGTAGCVRAGIQQGLLYNQIQRLWYLGPMFRHERPQKGRCRQFHQFGIEAFGMQGPDIDVEQILLMKRLWQTLGLQNQVELQVNSLGTPASRTVYRQALVTYYQKHFHELDEDSQRRLELNPLRILDSKNSVTIEINRQAPKLLDYLDEGSRQHFENFCQLLTNLGVAYNINPNIVRGLDYYCYTVYEWVTTQLGAQGTVCAGGRYDGLAQELGGKPTPGVGFAMGLERVVLLLQQHRELLQTPHAVMVLMGEAAVVQGMKIAEQLREAYPWLRLDLNLSAGGFKTQFKRADKSGARFALIIGQDELNAHKITLKDLRTDAEQQQISFSELTVYLEGVYRERI